MVWRKPWEAGGACSSLFPPFSSKLGSLDGGVSHRQARRKLWELLAGSQCCDSCTRSTQLCSSRLLDLADAGSVPSTLQAPAEIVCQKLQAAVEWMVPIQVPCGSCLQTWAILCFNLCAFYPVASPCWVTCKSFTFHEP